MRREEHAPKVESNNANGTHGDTASTADGIYHRFESCPDYKERTAAMLNDLLNVH